MVIAIATVVFAGACAGQGEGSGALPDPLGSVLHPDMASQIQAWEANRGREDVHGLVSAQYAVAAAVHGRAIQDVRVACASVEDYANALLQLPALPEPEAARLLKRGATLFREGADACIRLVYKEPVGSSFYVPPNRRHAVELEFARDMDRGMNHLKAAGARVEQITGVAFPGR